MWPVILTLTQVSERKVLYPFSPMKAVTITVPTVMGEPIKAEVWLEARSVHWYHGKSPLASSLHVEVILSANQWVGGCLRRSLVLIWGPIKKRLDGRLSWPVPPSIWVSIICLYRMLTTMTNHTFSRSMLCAKHVVLMSTLSVPASHEARLGLRLTFKHSELWHKN